MALDNADAKNFFTSSASDAVVLVVVCQAASMLNPKQQRFQHLAHFLILVVNAQIAPGECSL